MGKIDFRHNRRRDKDRTIRKIMVTKIRKNTIKGTKRQRILIRL